MKTTTGVLIGVLDFLLISFNINGQAADKWHYPLYLSNMDYWHSRIPVSVENSSTRDVSGESVKMKIGIGKGELHLAGVEATGIRVMDSRGTELLWRVTSPDEELITEGALSNESKFLLPATVKAGASEMYYIYFNNPAAWPVGAVLEGHHKVINGGFEKKADGGPVGWRLGLPDEERKVQSCREYPHSGEYCLRILNLLQNAKDGAGAKQQGIFIRGGAKYRVEGWVRAKEVHSKRFTCQRYSVDSSCMGLCAAAEEYLWGHLRLQVCRRYA